MWTDSYCALHMFFIILIFSQISEVCCLRKCCRKGAKLTENGKYCTVYLGKNNSTNNYTQNDVLYSETYWLPSKMFRTGMKVTYGASPCLENKMLLLLINDTKYDIRENEILVLTDIKKQYITKKFDNDSYCIDFIDGSMGPHVIKICACNDVVCIDKCCPQGQVVNLNNHTFPCVHNTSQRLPHRVVDKQDTPVVYKFPNGFFCKEGNLKKGIPKYLRGGSLYSTDLDRVYRLFTEEVKCVDHVNGTKQILTCSRPTTLLGVEYLSRSLSVVVATILTLTLFALWSLAELRATTHGRAFFCHVFSLAMVNTLRAASHLYGHEPQICLNFALSVYFFLVAANVWVNVLTLDMADGLRRPLHERAVGDTGRWKRTIFFNIYAWGFAAVLTTIAARAEFNPESKLPKPTYQETRTCRFEECGYLGRHATLTYYYGPMGTLFLVNLAIYAYLAIRLDRLNADSEMVDEQAMNDSAPAHRSGTIFFRLLMMMGTIEWVVEFTMWGLRGKYRTTEYLGKYKRFATIEDEHHSQTEFRIAGVVLDALRAASVAWVCCGRPHVRRRLGESVRRTLRRPLRLASALSSSAAANSNSDGGDQDPHVGGRAIKFLRRSARRLRSWPQRVKPQPPHVGRSLSEEPASASAPASEHIEMRTFSVSSHEDTPPPSPTATSGV